MKEDKYKILIKRIKKKGYSVVGFCNNVLDLEYMTFRSQYAEGIIKWKTLLILKSSLELSWEDLEKLLPVPEKEADKAKEAERKENLKKLL